MKVGFIGPGKVGVSLGRYFTQKGIKLTGFYGINIKTAAEAAKVTKSKFYKNIQDIVKESDILFITTPDDIISIIDKEISKFDLKNKSICHTSGSIQSNVLYNAKHSGALIYSIHPIFAFSSKNLNLKELETIYFSIEGDTFNDSILENIPVIALMKGLGNKFFIRNSNTSSIYHLANVFVSNLTLSLLDIGTSYLKQLGLSEEDSIKAIYPLIEGNIKNIFEKGFLTSLTGPVVRGDIKPIEKHISVLNDKDKEIYKSLSINLLKLVALRDVNSIQNGNENAFNEDNHNEDKLNCKNSTENEEKAMRDLLNNSEKHLEIYKLLGGLD